MEPSALTYMRSSTLVATLAVLAIGCARELPPSEPLLLSPAGEMTTVRGEVGDGVVDRWATDLGPGEVVRIEVDQQHLDLAIRVFDGNEELLFVFDTETGTFTPERFCFQADKDSSDRPYLFEVYSLGGSGSYKLDARRLPPESGTLCAEATRTFVAARDARQTPINARPGRLQSAAELWARAGEPALAALAFRDSGSASLHLDRGDATLAAFEQGLALAEEARDTYLQISLLNRQGLAQLELDDPHAAGRSLSRALELARDTDHLHGEASALLNLGRFDTQVGETHRAIERYRQALPMWERLGSLRDQAQTHLNLADAYGLLDHHQEGFDAVDRGLALARQAGDRRRESDLLSARGWLHYLAGRPQDGIPWLEEALEIRQELGHRIGETSALNRLGTLLEAQGDLESAEALVLQSLEASLAADNLPDIAANHASLGCLYQRMGRVEAARRQLDEARRRLGDREDPKAQSHLDYCLALVARDEGDLTTALGHIDDALEVVEDLRQVARPRGQRYRPIWLWQDYSQFRVELLVALHSTDRPEYLDAAFASSDFDRARSLFELVVESHLAPFAGDRQQHTRERRLQQRLNRLALLRLTTANGTNPGLDGDIALEIRVLGLELAQVRAEVRAQASSAAAETTPFEAPRPLPRSELSALLDDETLLLSYDLGEQRSFLFTVDNRGAHVFELAPRSELEIAAETFYRGLRNSAEVEDQWQLTGRHLAELLLPSGAIPPRIRRLLVVAEGMLLYIPFAALPMDPLPWEPPTYSAAATPADRQPLLLDQFEIVNLPSASVLAALRARRQQEPTEVARRSLAVFADPAYSTVEEPPRGQENFESAWTGFGATRDIAIERLPGGDLPRLPWTLHEALTIAEQLDEGDPLVRLGHEATKSAVLSTDLRTFRWFHFAGHARIDEEFPELSSLILSTVDHNGQTLDGELRLHEIYRLRLDTELTVLSGCQTALGKWVRGDGLLGLTRGFFYAGSSRLVVSLWPVEDRATAHLMPRLYRTLRQPGVEPAEALREAQLWMRQQPEWSAPYYWAAFVLQGDF